ncbi:metallophosphoesterase family protein [Candidatus Berkelbacteria bacterium]|nr:metallophosphoesterase family protein [Candidatus Berkelbacteria bacterium]
MRTIIVSDTHLTSVFRHRKCSFLRSIIEPADQVILNGDFWDSYVTSFDRFVMSPWQELFPLLKARNAVYLYGNHDPKDASDERVRMFSVTQTNTFVLTLPNFHFSSGNGEVSELVIQHGHRIVPHSDAWLPGWALNPLSAAAGSFSELLPFRLFGPRYFQVFAHHNERMKAWAAANLTPNQILVTGHNHLAELDLAHRYICTGFVRYGLASYLKIEDGALELVTDRY